MQLSPRPDSIYRVCQVPLLIATFLAAVWATRAADAADPDSSDRPSSHAVPTGQEAGQQELPEDTATYRASSEVAAYTDSDHVTVLTPSIGLGVGNLNGASLRASYLVDVVSAASVDIVSTASPRWEEVRHAGSLSAEYKPGDFGIGMGGSVSSEPDYVSYGGYLRLIKDFDEKNWTVFLGGGVSRDILGRCGGPSGECTSFSVFSRRVVRGSLNGGASVVVDQASVASLAMDVILESGDQSKPYRYVPMFSPDVAATVPRGADVEWVNNNRLPEQPLEQLPLSRTRYALTARYARRMGPSTLRLMQRGYYDTWGLAASSTDARFILDFGARLAVAAHGRFHTQRNVVFWRRAYVSGPGWDLPLYRTGDRELGPLWTAMGGLGLNIYLGSAADPKRWALELMMDTMYTSFLDNVFVVDRTAALGALGVNGAF
jgi:hypothetical protein